jgi:hypothetical protein
MAKPNYSYEKRQRELARKKKQEEKRLRHARPKSNEAGADSPESAASSAADTPAQDSPAPDDAKPA